MVLAWLQAAETASCVASKAVETLQCPAAHAQDLYRLTQERGRLDTRAAQQDLLLRGHPFADGSAQPQILLPSSASPGPALHTFVSMPFVVRAFCSALEVDIQVRAF